MADEVLQQGVRGITDLMVMPGLINLDFADVRTVMSEMGKAMMGTGESDGENRAIEAAEKAIANPLLDGVSMKGAKGVIVSITGGEDMRLMEVDEAASHIKELVDPDANIIWGSAFNPDLEGKIRVSVVATGIEADAASEPRPAQVFSFPPARKAEETKAEPVAAAAPIAAPEPVAEEVAVAEEAPLELSDVTEDAATEATAVEPEAEAPVTLTPPTADAASDELVLGGEEMFAEPVASNPLPPVAEEPSGHALRRGWLSSSEDEAPAAEPERPAPKIAPLGGTLFERMSNIARGAAKADETDASDPLDIPRFLNRQNNQ